MRVLTASASSTSDLARNSTSSFTISSLTATSRSAKAAHHLLHGQVLLEQPVDLLHGRAGAFGDPFLACAVDDLRKGALFLSHGVEDGLHAHDGLLVDIAFLHLVPQAGEHSHELRERAHLLDLRELRAKVFQRELVFRYPMGELL